MIIGVFLLPLVVLLGALDASTIFQFPLGCLLLLSGNLRSDPLGHRPFGSPSLSLAVKCLCCETSFVHGLTFS
jgi:hypothetical protein